MTEPTRHYEETPPNVHQLAFHSETDPALDPDNAVAPGKFWFVPSLKVLRIRSLDDTQWEFLGQS